MYDIEFDIFEVMIITLTPNPKSGCNGNAFPTKLTLQGQAQ